MNKIISLLMFADFFYIIGLAGPFENDLITTTEFLIKVSIAFVILLVLDYIKSRFVKRKKAYRSANYNKQIKK